MNTGNGLEAARAARKHIMNISERSVYWKARQRDGVESANDCLQLLSNKSHTSVRAGPLAFYPLSINWPNVTEEARRSHVSSNISFCSNVSERFDEQKCI